MTGNEYNDANLNHAYMIVYQDMLRYLSSKDISLLVARDIRDDILAMALESQTRGLKVEEAFGDYQKFCDAVCANAVQETRLEKLLRWWSEFRTIRNRRAPSVRSIFSWQHRGIRGYLPGLPPKRVFSYCRRKPNSRRRKRNAGPDCVARTRAG